MTYDWPFFMKFYAVELEMVYKWSVHKFIVGLLGNMIIKIKYIKAFFQL
jgi:hypothetical protein